MYTHIHTHIYNYSFQLSYQVQEKLKKTPVGILKVLNKDIKKLKINQ